MSVFNKGWYLLYTSSKQEKKIAEQLAKFGITNYLPMIEVVRRWSDRNKVIKRPLFPSYLFIYLNNKDDYYQSLNIKGALRYVKDDDQIARIPDVIINNIKIVSENMLNLEVANVRLKEGQVLMISRGPLSGLNCEVVRYKNKEMLLVRISLINRHILAELPERYLLV